MTDAGLANLAEALRQTIYSGDVPSPLRVAVNAPVTFHPSIQQLLHLGFGSTLLPVPEAVRIDPDAFVSYLDANDIDVLDATPTHVRMLLTRVCSNAP